MSDEPRNLELELTLADMQLAELRAQLTAEREKAARLERDVEAHERGAAMRKLLEGLPLPSHVVAKLAKLEALVDASRPLRGYALVCTRMPELSEAANRELDAYDAAKVELEKLR